MTRRNLRRTDAVTPAKQDKIIEALENGHSNAGACKLAGVGTHWFYDRLNQNGTRYDEAFEARVRAAQEAGTDFLEDVARNRAVEGVDRYQFHQGKAILDPVTGEPYKITTYSDTLLMFLLNGRRPEKFVQYHKHGGDPSNPIQVRTIHELVSKASKLPLTIDQDGNIVEVKGPRQEEAA